MKDDKIIMYVDVEKAREDRSYTFMRQSENIEALVTIILHSLCFHCSNIVRKSIN